MMWLLAPVAWPLAWVLDKVLGREVGTLYSRAELKHLITLHVEHPDAPGGGGGSGPAGGGGGGGGALTREDYKVLAGALGIRDKRVRDVMTPIGRTFMVAASTRLSFENMLRIYESGYTRIPVHEDGDRQAIIGILYAKDLILVDPDDEIEVRAIIALRAGVDHLGGGGHGGTVGVADAAAAAGSLAAAAAAAAHPATAATAPLDAGGVQYVLDATPLNEVFKLFKTCGTHLMVACRLRADAHVHAPPSPVAGGGSATHGRAVAAALAGNGGGGSATGGGAGGGPLQKSTTGSTAFWLAASPGRDVTGVITLEDVLEEVIQDEIVDESDAFVSNDQTTRVVRSRGGKGGRAGGGGAASSYLSLFEHKRRDASRLSSAEVTAAAAFLSASVAEFRRFAPADAVLKGLIRQAEVIDCCADAAAAAAAGGGSLAAAAASMAGLVGAGADSGRSAAGGRGDASPGGGGRGGSPRPPTPPPALLSTLARGDSGGSDASGGGGTGAATPSASGTGGGGPGGPVVGEVPLYARGVPACHLTLILQGRVAVRAGTEEFASDLGPWSVMGAKALGTTPGDPYIPDFCADALPPARVLRIHADAYRVAVRVAAANAVAAGRAVKQALYGTTLRAMSGVVAGAAAAGVAAAGAAPPPVLTSPRLEGEPEDTKGKEEGT